MFQLIKQFLDNQNPKWFYQVLEDNSLITLGIKGKSGMQFQLIIEVSEKDNIIIAYSIYPMSASSEKMPTISEFINRINYSRIIGNFELDYEDGEIRFKTSGNYKGIAPNIEYVENIIMSNIVSMDTASKYIADVLLKDANPLEVSDKLRDNK